MYFFLKENMMPQHTEPPEVTLENIHSRMQFFGGNIKDEYPEQLMVCTWLHPQSNVLELGANFGRNTLTISSILTDSKNLVTLETDPNSHAILVKNRDANNLHFRTENAALSYKRLWQRGWVTQPSDEPLPGHLEVKTVTFEDLEKKHDITFDTLVCDCEGALYFIAKDNPNVFDNMKLVILENDFLSLEHKLFVDKLMVEKGLYCVYSQLGPWGPCRDRFYEVWKRL